MRILHVNKFLYPRGGAEAYMLDLAALQRAAGHEVEFFGMEHQQNPPQRFGGHFPKPVQFDPPPTGLRRRAMAAGRMVWSVAGRRGMEEVVRSFRPHLAHLHNIYHQLSPSVLRPLARAGVPTVMTLHDYKLACPTYLFLDHGKVCEACLDGFFGHAVLRRCKDDSVGASAVLALESTVHRLTGAYGSVRVFVCPSRFMAAKMAQAGVYPDRLHVLSNFVDVSGLTPKTEPGGPVVYSGRLWPEKGVDVLIEAIARLDAGRLVVVGEGPERPKLEALAADRAPGRVRFLGWLPRDRVLGLVRSATVLAVPSRSHENQPLVVLEAFACGVPVVASDLGGLPELVEPGRYGETAPAGDPDALAAALGRLLADPDRALAMGRAARARAEAEFAPERHLDQLMGLYARAGAAAAVQS
jgi:glycosyltransferase involved in cell wall biosynthesis